MIFEQIFSGKKISTYLHSPGRSQYPCSLSHPGAHTAEIGKRITVRNKNSKHARAGGSAEQH